MSRILMAMIVTVLSLALPGDLARAAERPDAREVAAIVGGLAEVDSLLAADDPDRAVLVGSALHDRWSGDPLYGWQIAGRLGLALSRAGRNEEAVPLLETAVLGNPGDARLHRNLAFGLRSLGRRGRALTEYQTVVDLAPADASARLEYGHTLMEFGDLRRAADEFLLADRLCGGCPEATAALATVAIAREDWAAAVGPLGDLWRRQGDPGLRKRLAVALFRTGRPDSVIGLLGAVDLADLDGDECRLLVQSEEALGNDGVQSRRMIHAATGNRSLPAGLLADGVFWAKVAGNLLAAGDPAGALEAADRSVTLEPDNAIYRNNRVAILLELGRESEAREEWARVLALDPGLAGKEPRR
ncbi:MAG: tetratricopeptide repeat protein [Candidatus Krumholzibacteriia bacterium]